MPQAPAGVCPASLVALRIKQHIVGTDVALGERYKDAFHAIGGLFRAQQDAGLQAPLHRKEAENSTS